MNDNDIIKALECCQTKYNKNCEKCPYEFHKTSCINYMTCDSILLSDVLSLINRQKAEIERLEKIRADLSKYVAELKEYIDRCERGEEYWVKCLLERPNEAIKEFAERLQDRFFNYYDVLNENTSKSNYRGETLMVYEVADMIENCIDNLVKEMAGEKE